MGTDCMMIAHYKHLDTIYMICAQNACVFKAAKVKSDLLLQTP